MCKTFPFPVHICTARIVISGVIVCLRVFPRLSEAVKLSFDVPRVQVEGEEPVEFIFEADDLSGDVIHMRVSHDVNSTLRRNG